MKKLICFLSVALVLAACSSDDDNSSSSVVLLKKTIETDSDGEVITSNASYNGTKLDKITATGGFVIDFTYTGDLITKAEYKIGGVVVQTNTYTYANDKIATFTRVEPQDDLGYKEIFVHNGDGSVSVTVFIGDADTQATPNGTAEIEFTNGEVATITTSGFGVDHTYTYDAKNSPFKNVTGYSKISYTDGEAEGILHNVTLDDTGFSEVSTTYTYNANDYPTSAIEDDGGDETTTEFFYN